MKKITLKPSTTVQEVTDFLSINFPSESPVSISTLKGNIAGPDRKLRALTETDISGGVLIEIKNSLSETVNEITNMTGLIFITSDQVEVEDAELSTLIAQLKLKIEKEKLDGLDISEEYNSKALAEYEKENYDKAIYYFKVVFELTGKGGPLESIANCFYFMDDGESCLSYLIKCAEVRKSRLGMNDSSTIDTVKKSIELAGTFGTMDQIPSWFHQVYFLETPIEAEEGGSEMPVVNISQNLIEIGGPYADRHAVESEYFANRDLKLYVPEFIEEIENCSQKWTKAEIEQIVSNIDPDGKKIIPMLSFVPDEIIEVTDKQLWFVAPFLVYADRFISWIAVTKNGLYGCYEDDNNVQMLVTWSNVESINPVEYITNSSGEFDNIADILINMNDGGELSFHEFIEEGQGSKLEIIYAIWKCYKDTIEASQGEPRWFHGAGAEGYVVIESINDLLNPDAWDSADFPDPTVYGYHREENSDVANTITVKPGMTVKELRELLSNHYQVNIDLNILTLNGNSAGDNRKIRALTENNLSGGVTVKLEQELSETIDGLKSILGINIGFSK